MSEVESSRLDVGVDPGIQTREIIIQSRVLQSQLEGMFRKMYQACTQEAYMGQLAVYASCLESCVELHDRIELLHDELMSIQSNQNNSQLM